MHDSLIFGHLAAGLWVLLAGGDRLATARGRTSSYINLRRSRDGTVFVPSSLRVFVCYPRFIQFASATCYAVHINALSI